MLLRILKRWKINVFQGYNGLEFCNIHKTLKYRNASNNFRDLY